jgi:hypothetical protein
MFEGAGRDGVGVDDEVVDDASKVVTVLVDWLAVADEVGNVGVGVDVEGEGAVGSGVGVVVVVIARRGRRSCSRGWRANSGGRNDRVIRGVLHGRGHLYGGCHRGDQVGEGAFHILKAAKRETVRGPRCTVENART